MLGFGHKIACFVFLDVSTWIVTGFFVLEYLCVVSFVNSVLQSIVPCVTKIFSNAI